MAQTNRFGLKVLRALLLFGTTALSFRTLRKLQLAETPSTGFAAPLIGTLIIGPLLGEWSNPRRSASSARWGIGVWCSPTPERPQTCWRP
ncbi:hypothetical protein ASF60_16460 [Methylobacterium sp. Leaf113]|uniref:hypothetical protein n=1 Tax=Methylobacterium sp. Leaf113 TaxID=1736259 RepID=UPI0006F652FE|nr:hypothetical protein [Methylobacterium sp. Leaf113]KQP92711.1 hypothetical protein ASF60_16460 [Methylobacterium sp. Leaf113]